MVVEGHGSEWLSEVPPGGGEVGVETAQQTEAAVVMPMVISGATNAFTASPTVTAMEEGGNNGDRRPVGRRGDRSGQGHAPKGQVFAQITAPWRGPP